MLPHLVLKDVEPLIRCTNATNLIIAEVIYKYSHITHNKHSTAESCPRMNRNVSMLSCDRRRCCIKEVWLGGTHGPVMTCADCITVSRNPLEIICVTRGGLHRQDRCHLTLYHTSNSASSPSEHRHIILRCKLGKSKLYFSRWC